MFHLRLRGALRASLLVAVLLNAPSAQAAESTDLIWPRIASGMHIVDPEQAETVTWARHYAKHPAQLAAMLARAEPFLWYIVEAVELREMPLELALLPAIESGFNPQARSQDQARGLWQFVPSTGRAYGLKENRHYDGKRDPVASTRAALTYLHKLQRQFDGDWLLALAAYNFGGRALSESIERSGSRNFWELDLPRETREHIPRLLGLALLIQQPERFGVELPPILNRHAAELVTLDSARDLQRAALRAGVDEDLIERYNPGLKTLSNTQGKSILLLPREEATKLRAELARREYRPRKPPPSAQHVVARGESLWTIARRYNTTVAQLREWNDLQPRAVLRPGRKLEIRQIS